MITQSGEAGKVSLESVFSGRHDRRKVTDWVYEELKNAIVELRLPPGEPLREASLADRLGVSKTPIREALTRLEREGLVETTSFKGAVVTGYSRQDLIEIYELRELLENLAVRAAAESMDTAGRAQLTRIGRESRKLARGGDTAKLTLLLSEFDALVFAQVHNRRIRALIENLQAHLTRIGQLTTVIPGRILASVDEHDKIIEAIGAHDADQAERYMSEHIRSVRDDQLRALTQGIEHA
ncbi:MAG TPA: GntR family transcriptional regulator [Streptosporangiaceae bacterium]